MIMNGHSLIMVVITQGGKVMKAKKQIKFYKITPIFIAECELFNALNFKSFIINGLWLNH